MLCTRRPSRSGRAVTVTGRIGTARLRSAVIRVKRIGPADGTSSMYLASSPSRQAPCCCSAYHGPLASAVGTTRSPSTS